MKSDPGLPPDDLPPAAADGQPSPSAAAVAARPPASAPGPPPAPRPAAPVLAYRTAADEWVDLADRPPHPVVRFLVAGRWVWLTLYALGVLVPAGLMCADEPASIAGVLVVLVVLVGTQALFLVGAPHLRRPRGRHRRAMWVSLAVGGVGATLLTIGLVFTLLNLVDRWHDAARWAGSVAGGGPGPLVLAVPVLLTWAAWVGVFALLFAGEWYDWFRGFRRLYATLVGGTVLELLVTIPVDAQVRKRTSCWCEEGTFFALIIGGSMAVWTFGPGIALLFLTRRLQRRRRPPPIPAGRGGPTK